MVTQTELMSEASPARRIFLWSAAGALIVAAAPFFLTLALYSLFIFADWEPGDKLTSYIIPLLTISTAFALLPMLAGTLIGLVSVLSAPTTEPTLPMKSVFFRTVLGQTVWMWAVAFLCIHWGVASMFESFRYHPTSDAMPVIVGVIVFPFCLCCALYVAKRNACSLP